MHRQIHRRIPSHTCTRTCTRQIDVLTYACARVLSFLYLSLSPTLSQALSLSLSRARSLVLKYTRTHTHTHIQAARSEKAGAEAGARALLAESQRTRLVERLTQVEEALHELKSKLQLCAPSFAALAEWLQAQRPRVGGVAGGVRFVKMLEEEVRRVLKTVVVVWEEGVEEVREQLRVVREEEEQDECARQGLCESVGALRQARADSLDLARLLVRAAVDDDDDDDVAQVAGTMALAPLSLSAGTEDSATHTETVTETETADSHTIEAVDVKKDMVGVEGGGVGECTEGDEGMVDGGGSKGGEGQEGQDGTSGELEEKEENEEEIEAVMRGLKQVHARAGETSRVIVWMYADYMSVNMRL